MSPEDTIRVKTLHCTYSHMQIHFLFWVYVHYSHNRSFLLLNSSRIRNIITQILQHSSATWHFKRLRTMGCIIFYISLLLEWVLLRYTVKKHGEYIKTHIIVISLNTYSIYYIEKKRTIYWYIYNIMFYTHTFIHRNYL